jgi:hypothetical protein
MGKALGREPGSPGITPGLIGYDSSYGSSMIWISATAGVESRYRRQITVWDDTAVSRSSAEAVSNWSRVTGHIVGGVSAGLPS